MLKVYESSTIDEENRNFFIGCRDQINAYLDSETNITAKKVDKQRVEVSSEILTHRRIMDTFIYGGLSHANTSKKEEYDSWMAFAPSATVYKYMFVEILGKVMHAISYISHLNAEVLHQIK